MTASAKLAPAVCLLGGESSGKTTLAHQLLDVLNRQGGLSVTLVPEVLRQWCEQHQRAPRAEEQASIALAQSQAVFKARCAAGTQLVIADTSALTIAVYSELYFKDTSLTLGALRTQKSFTGQLLMGLDLAWTPDGLFRDSVGMRAQTDGLLRERLQGASIPFQTVYGAKAQRLHNALRALAPLLSPLLGESPVATSSIQTDGRPGWVCEACSDPECEHRLFTRLL